MGSGVLLAILVALWFVVLVPMVVTRGDLAATPAEPMRVLRRRSDRSAMSSNVSSHAGSSSAGSSGAGSSGAGSSGAGSSSAGSGRQPDRSAATRAPEAENMMTEPIPVLPRRIPGATMDKDQRPVAGRPVKRVVAEQPVAEAPSPDNPERGEVDIRGRRRRMLTGLVALAVLWALFAAFWQPVLWWPQIVLDLVVFSYLVFLRLEAQREQDRQERRRARAASRVKLPEDRTERMVRKHSQYQAQVTAATEHQAIALDDDDPSFAEMPTWQASRSREAAVDDAAYWSARKAV